MFFVNIDIQTNLTQKWTQISRGFVGNPDEYVLYQHFNGAIYGMEILGTVSMMVLTVPVVAVTVQYKGTAAYLAPLPLELKYQLLRYTIVEYELYLSTLAWYYFCTSGNHFYINSIFITLFR